MPTLRTRSNSVQAIGVANSTANRVSAGFAGLLDGLREEDDLGSGPVGRAGERESSHVPTVAEADGGQDEEVVQVSAPRERSASGTPVGKGSAARGTSSSRRSASTTKGRGRLEEDSVDREPDAPAHPGHRGRPGGSTCGGGTAFVSEATFRDFAEDVSASLEAMAQNIQEILSARENRKSGDNPKASRSRTDASKDEGQVGSKRSAAKSRLPSKKVRAASESSSSSGTQDNDDDTSGMSSDGDVLGSGVEAEEEEESFRAVEILVRLMRPLLKGSNFTHPGALEASLYHRCILPSPADLSSGGLGNYRTDVDLFNKFRGQLRDFDARVLHHVSPFGTVRWSLSRLVASCEPSLEELARRILIGYVTRWGVDAQFRHDSKTGGSSSAASVMTDGDLMEAALIGKHHGAQIMTKEEQLTLLASMAKVKKVFSSCGRATAQAGLGTGMEMVVADGRQAGALASLQELMRGCGKTSPQIEVMSKAYMGGTSRIRRRILRRARYQFRQTLSEVAVNPEETFEGEQISVTGQDGGKVVESSNTPRKHQ